jgi:hypothetical protein
VGEAEGGEGVIYFLQSIEGGPIKIGFTDDLMQRHRQLEKHYARPLALLATMEGGADREAEIHRQFDHLRFGRTEQFRPGPDLMAFIGRPLLVHPNPDTVEVMLSRSAAEDAEFGLTAVKIDRGVASMAKWVASSRGITLAEYLTELLRGPVGRDMAKGSKRLTSGEDHP